MIETKCTNANDALQFSRNDATRS